MNGLARDEYYCHFPIRFTDKTYRPSRRTEKQQIHHVDPYRYAQVHLGWNLEQINSPENLITLSERYHIGVIHPDIFVAKEKYRNGDKQAFEYCFAHRRRLCDAGGVYWFNAYDDVFKRIAYERTNRFSQDYPFPQRLRRLAS